MAIVKYLLNLYESTIGICKIIPPPEWLQAFPVLSDIKLVKDMIVKTPVRQQVTRQGGCAHVDLLELRSRTVGKQLNSILPVEHCLPIYMFLKINIVIL